MSSRNIAVQRDVYNALRKEKRAGESFTALFVRLMNQRTSIEEARAAWGVKGLADELRALKDLRGSRHRGRA